MSGTGKNVYSLVLSDEVVQEIDQLAYQNNTNRSNMINQILAEYVSYTTPEKRLHQIFDRMEDLLLHGNDGPSVFRLQSLPTDTLFSLRSALQYKYNPTVRYSIELYRQMQDGVIGELRVSLRTQNQTLIALLGDFYRLWDSIENLYFNDIQMEEDGGKYTRLLKLHYRKDAEHELSGITVGDVISRYVSTFDEALKTYFELRGSSEDPAGPLRTIYQNYLKGEVFV